MNIIQIPKGGGRWRTIYAPSKEERIVLNTHMNAIRNHREFTALTKDNTVHAFCDGRSPVTNALQHLGYSYTLSMDLKDFFDSVTPEHLPEELRFPECFPDGAARQGLPTSPVLANIAARKMDEEILAMLPNKNKNALERALNLFMEKREDIHVVYTRYADDLCFSSNVFDLLKFLPKKIKRIAESHGFTVNEAKTKFQWAGAGRRMITGVAVDSKVHCPRYIRRRIRAAGHQRHTAELRGLQEWAKMKVPAKFNESFWTPVIAKTTQVIQVAVNNIKTGAERFFRFE